MVEQFNCVLKEVINLAKGAGLDWRKEVMKVCMYRLTPHATTGKSPFVCLKGGVLAR